MSYGIIDFYSEANQNTTVSIGTSLKGVAQSFTGDGHKVTTARFYCYRVNAYSTYVYAKIYAHTGTFGTDGIPTGAPLATSDGLIHAALATSLTLTDFTFSDENQITLTEGTKYVVTLEYSSTGATVEVGVDDSSPSHSGNYSSTTDSSTWTPSSTKDLIFYVIGNFYTQSNSVKANIYYKTTHENYVKASIRTAIASNSVKANINVTNTDSNSVKSNVYWLVENNNVTKSNIVTTNPNSNRVTAHISAHSFNKYFEYRIYDRSGNFITTWSKEVLSEPSFRMVINGCPGEMVVKLARTFDSFGEEEDVTLFNEVRCYCFDKDSVNGVLIYSGYISGYRPVLDGASEYLEITLLHYGVEMSNIMLRNGAGETTISMTSTDPSQMLKNVINYYRADNGKINYTSDSIEDTGTTVSYDFQTYDIKESIDKIIELTPMYWYYYVDADNTIYLKYSNLSSAQHSFVVGRHISKVETWRRGEDICNKVYFVGAETAGVSMYRVYTNTASVASYGIRAETLIDQRVTQPTTADIMANRVINRKKDPEIRTTITILDNNGYDSWKGYDIESIKPGQTMRIKNLKQGIKTVTRWDQFNWDEDVWDQTLTYAAADNIQIQSVEYHPNYVVIEASSRIPDIAKRVEDVYRNLEETQTINTPASATDVI